MRGTAILWALVPVACGAPADYLLSWSPDPPPSEPPTLPAGDDGWDAAPASGIAYIVNQIAITDAGRGFDVDGRCDAGSCVDNRLAMLGELGNDQVRQGLLGGESLLLLELAGQDQADRANDGAVTLKLYGARDSEDPFFPANNFKVPPGQTTCCTFLINPESVSGDPPQTRGRLHAELRNDRLTTLAPATLELALTVGVRPHPIAVLEQARISALVLHDEINEGLIGAAIPVSGLAQMENSYCKTVSPQCPTISDANSMLDLIAGLVSPEPDIDLDGDGPECVLDGDGDGLIDRCCDGGGCDNGRCLGVEVGPVDPADPASCALDPRMADGYSIGITFTAVRAQILGVGR